VLQAPEARGMPVGSPCHIASLKGTMNVSYVKSSEDGEGWKPLSAMRLKPV
jgi:hypothetical protein